MRRQASDLVYRSSSGWRTDLAYLRSPIGRRFVQISAAPSSPSPSLDSDFSSLDSTLQTTPDAKFEVLGSPYSLLSVSLSPSQYLHTRRGTLVGVSGKVENAKSTLRLLEPFRRAALGIPFLYQRITSTSPLNALLSTKSPVTTFSIVHLDGRVDWMVAQRKALLAWTGNTLSIRPTFNTGLSLAHWGNSVITGRGLVALAGQGQIYQVTLKTGEDYVVHPGNVLAYTIMRDPPLPYRFEVSSLNLHIPNLGSWLPEMGIVRGMMESPAGRFLVNSTYIARRFVANASYSIRSWMRKYVWGDRLFLRFQGPSTILIQSRASRLSDVLTTRDVNEIAETPAGAVQEAIELKARKESGHGSSTQSSSPSGQSAPATTKLSYATIGNNKKVEFGSS